MGKSLVPKTHNKWTILLEDPINDICSWISNDIQALLILQMEWRSFK